MVFWITSHMKAKREQIYGDLLVIKLFASNYARDLMNTWPTISQKITILEFYLILFA